eukprot:gene44126-25020_t
MRHASRSSPSSHGRRVAFVAGDDVWLATLPAPQQQQQQGEPLRCPFPMRLTSGMGRCGA